MLRRQLLQSGALAASGILTCTDFVQGGAKLLTPRSSWCSNQERDRRILVAGGAGIHRSASFQGAQLLSNAGNAKFQGPSGTNAFTAFWVKLDTIVAATYYSFFDIGPVGTEVLGMRLDGPTGHVVSFAYNDVNTFTQIDSLVSLTAGLWYHLQTNWGATIANTIYDHNGVSLGGQSGAFDGAIPPTDRQRHRRSTWASAPTTPSRSSERSTALPTGVPATWGRPVFRPLWSTEARRWSTANWPMERTRSLSGMTSTRRRGRPRGRTAARTVLASPRRARSSQSPGRDSRLACLLGDE